MPRTHHAGVSTLRNRNRITNKTRLKILHGNLESDASLVPDEDEERYRQTNLVAGVDAEDANEHHLQEVLNLSLRTAAVVAAQASSGDASGSATAVAQVVVTFIPTPDSTGVVENHEEFYPPNRWQDPAGYVFSSSTVEDATADGLTGGFTYYMDERDKEWLDKNNEEARGEGTSAQGAVSPSNARTSRSAKGKGKEPEALQPVVISENEFELVMGLFEKITQEKGEPSLHVRLERGMPFPPFADYQEIFSLPLPGNFFTTYVVPSWLPPPNSLLKIAHVVYPYWKERRLQRNGQAIMATLNYDEADTLNESYVCFRRREVKAVRKTRAQQTSSSEKLSRLHAELNYPLELAKKLLARETLKMQQSKQSQAIWEKRLEFAELKRKFPSLGDKLDEDLLFDREVKKPRVPLKIRTVPEATVVPPRPTPRERAAEILEQVEATLAKQKDPMWEDMIDNPYQAPYIPPTSRRFKFITPPGSDNDDDDDQPFRRNPRAWSLRVGRGGRLFGDRRYFRPPPMSNKRRRHCALVDSDDEDAMDVDENLEDIRRTEERWRFDNDDGPMIGPDGPDEQDRILVDDYDHKYLRYSMTLLDESDHRALISANIPNAPDVNRPMKSPHYPLPLYSPHSFMRMDARGHMLGSPAGAPNQKIAGPQLMNIAPSNGAVRISANGGMRPPNVPSIAQSVPVNNIVPLTPLPIPKQSPPNPATRPAITMPHVEVAKPDNAQVMMQHNGVVPMVHPQQQQQQQPMNVVQASPKAPNQPLMQQMPNGYNLTPMSSLTTPALAVSAPRFHEQYSNSMLLQQRAMLASLQQGNYPLPHPTQQFNQMPVAFSPTMQWGGAVQRSGMVDVSTPAPNVTMAAPTRTAVVMPMNVGVNMNRASVSPQKVQLEQQHQQRMSSASPMPKTPQMASLARQQPVT